jgi:hypothetical protein
VGTVLASALIAEVRAFLLDDSSALQRWSDPDLLGYLSDAQTEIVNLKHDALTLIEPLTTIADARQSLPANAVAFIAVHRNVGGGPITQVAKDMMDRAVPGWTLETGAAVLHYMRDDRDEKTFWIYPVVATDIEVTYTPLPEPLTADTDPIVLDDLYAPAMVDYAVYRALSSDLDNPANVNVAANWLQMFTGKVMGKSNAETRIGHNG